MALSPRLTSNIKSFGKGLAAGGPLISGFADMRAAQAQAEAADYNRKVALRNKTITAQKRSVHYDNARVAADDLRRENHRMMGQIRANFGASGLDMSGTLVDVISDQSAENALGERRVIDHGRQQGYESTLEILGFQDEANLLQLEASAARSRGRSALWGGIFASAGKAIASFI